MVQEVSVQQMAGIEIIAIRLPECLASLYRHPHSASAGIGYSNR